MKVRELKNGAPLAPARPSAHCSLINPQLLLE